MMQNEKKRDGANMHLEFAVSLCTYDTTNMIVFTPFLLCDYKITYLVHG